MGMKLQCIDHFVITISDLERSLSFYEGVLGMRHVCLTSGQHALLFGQQKINLHVGKGEYAPAAKHPGFGAQDFCLIADGDIHEIKKELEEKGISILEGVVEREGARGRMDSIYMYDPDGNLVEIAVYRV